MRDGRVYRIAAVVVMLLLVALALFHGGVLSGFVPQGHVWGGRTQDSGSFALLEIIALVVTLLFLCIVAARMRLSEEHRLQPIVTGALWVMTIYFLLNIAGNLASFSGWEKAVFTPVSALLAAGCCIMAIGPKGQRIPQ